MNKLLWLLIILGLLWGGQKLFNYWDKVARGEDPNEKPTNTLNQPLPGMAPELEDSLQAARKGGVDALGDWLQTYGYSVQDPRLADIQLDYVVMLSARDPKKAREIFQNVKKRINPSSPVYDRIQKLSKTYE